MTADGLHQAFDVESSVTTATTNVCDPSIWHNLANHPSSSLFTSKPWMEAVAATYGFNIGASAQFVGGKVAAALIFSHVSDVRGDRIISFPFSDFCDPLVSDPEDWRDMIAPLLARGVPINFRCLRNDIIAGDSRFRPLGQLAWHGVDLTRPEEKIWTDFPAVVRTGIRKGQRGSLVVREGRTLDDVRKFYEMHCHVRKIKYRLLPQPFSFFEHLHAAFAPDKLTVFLAEDHGVPAGGTVLIEWGDTLYYKFNASMNQDARPNDLIMWEAMRMGQRRGLKLLDFGASDLDQPGLIRFKRKYATEELMITRYRWEPPDYDPLVSNKANHLLRGVTELLTDPAVPVTITQIAGERMYGLFS